MLHVTEKCDGHNSTWTACTKDFASPPLPGIQSRHRSVNAAGSVRKFSGHFPGILSCQLDFLLWKACNLQGLKVHLQSFSSSDRRRSERESPPASFPTMSGGSTTWEDAQLQLISQNMTLIKRFQVLKYVNGMSIFQPSPKRAHSKLRRYLVAFLVGLLFRLSSYNDLIIRPFLISTDDSRLWPLVNAGFGGSLSSYISIMILLQSFF